MTYGSLPIKHYRNAVAHRCKTAEVAEVVMKVEEQTDEEGAKDEGGGRRHRPARSTRLRDRAHMEVMMHG